MPLKTAYRPSVKQTERQGVCACVCVSASVSPDFSQRGAPVTCRPARIQLPHGEAAYT